MDLNQERFPYSKPAKLLMYGGLLYITIGIILLKMGYSTFRLLWIGPWIMLSAQLVQLYIDWRNKDMRRWKKTLKMFVYVFAVIGLLYTLQVFLSAKR